uniref:Uncharacterized protein n=1 Tax=Anopheles stephensi TaxID=30069 RepID=A0A182YML9_ANOST
MSDLPITTNFSEKLLPENDVEQDIPAFKVIDRRKLLYEKMEVIDLTEDEFLREFKTFLNTLSDHRLDVDARRSGTKAKSSSVIYTLSVPVVFLSHVRTHQDTFINELFRINFSSSMVYGQLTAKTYRDDVTIYQLDDGTAKVEVYYRPSNNKMLDYLHKLVCCEDSLRKKSSPMNDESIPTSVELRRHLRLLISMAKARCHTHLAHFNLRTHCFVIGRPFVGNEGRIAVFAETILPDAELGYSCELFWKSFLLSIYEPLIESTVADNNRIAYITERLNKLSL